MVRPGGLAMACPGGRGAWPMNLNPFTPGRRKATFITAAFLAIVWGFHLSGRFKDPGVYYGTFTVAILGWLTIALSGHLADQKLPDRIAAAIGQKPGGTP